MKIAEIAPWKYLLMIKLSSLRRWRQQSDSLALWVELDSLLLSLDSVANCVYFGRYGISCMTHSISTMGRVNRTLVWVSTPALADVVSKRLRSLVPVSVRQDTIPSPITSYWTQLPVLSSNIGYILTTYRTAAEPLAPSLTAVLRTWKHQNHWKQISKIIWNNDNFNKLFSINFCP